MTAIINIFHYVFKYHINEYHIYHQCIAVASCFKTNQTAPDSLLLVILSHYTLPICSKLLSSQVASGIQPTSGHYLEVVVEVY